MYIGILRTYYEVIAIGKTKTAVKKRIVEGYKDFYPPNKRTLENPTFDELNEEFGCPIYEIDPAKGYAHE